MIEYLSPGSVAGERDAIEQEVTELGLTHRLATQWTSFVAVAKQVVNEGGTGVDADVAVPQAHGVPDTPTRPAALLAGNMGFTGHAGPEPATWLALLAIAAVGRLWWWRRRVRATRAGGRRGAHPGSRRRRAHSRRGALRAREGRPPRHRGRRRRRPRSREFARAAADLVVLDILMPEVDGLEVCRELRRTSAVPILFLSSRDEELDRVLGLELGADDYVMKPFSPRELVARVKGILRRAQRSAQRSARRPR